MNLAQFPRRRYTAGPTPIEHLPRLSQVLDGPQLFMKRDDLLGLASGGNKTRKLEFLIADALKEGSDTVITCGAVQSNHCRLTLAAAVKEGMKCHLVLEERVPNSYNPQNSGNNFLYHLLGVEGIRVVPGGSDMMLEMQQVAEELIAKGRKPYMIPGGGSNEIGSLGYVACAEEVLAQAFDQGLNISTVVCASGSGIPGSSTMGRTRRSSMARSASPAFAMRSWSRAPRRMRRSPPTPRRTVRRIGGTRRTRSGTRCVSTTAVIRSVTRTVAGSRPTHRRASPS